MTMTASEMGRKGGKVRGAQMTREELSTLGKAGARARWPEKSAVTELAEREGISRQAAWTRLNRKKKGKKKSKR